MKYFATLFFVLSMLSAIAQDRIWLDNGNPVQAKLSRAMDSKLEWIAADGIPRVYHRKAVPGCFLVQRAVYGDLGIK
jgi:hypothetical protein